MASVSAVDGTLRGIALSQDGREIPFGGVVALNGSFSAGSAATGSQFVGRFQAGSNGLAIGSGDWVLASSQGGSWYVERDGFSADCN